MPSTAERRPLPVISWTLVGALLSYALLISPDDIWVLFGAVGVVGLAAAIWRGNVWPAALGAISGAGIATIVMAVLVSNENLPASCNSADESGICLLTQCFESCRVDSAPFFAVGIILLAVGIALLIGFARRNLRRS